MNRFVLLGLALIACYVQVSQAAEESKRFVFHVKRDTRAISDLDQDFDEDFDGADVKRFVFAKREDGEYDEDMDHADNKRFYYNLKDAKEAAESDDMDGQKDFKRFIYSAKEARDA